MPRAICGGCLANVIFIRRRNESIVDHFGQVQIQYGTDERRTINTGIECGGKPGGQCFDHTVLVVKERSQFTTLLLQ